MSGTILNKRDQLPPRVGRRRHDIVEQVANPLDDGKIGSFVAPANVVGIADIAAFENERQRLGMILNVEPVADILTIAVDRERFATECFNDDVGN